MSRAVSVVMSVLGIFGAGTVVGAMGDVGQFFTESPLAMSGLCIASAVLGYWAHKLVRLFLNSRANEDKEFVKRLHAELKEKGCARYYDISCVTTLEGLAGKLAEMAGANPGKGVSRLESARPDDGNVPTSKRPRPAAPDTSDPFAGLVPAERELLLHVYEEATVRVEGDILQAAKSLNAKGLVYRLGFEGDRRAVIQGCEIVLADDAARLLNERADELRALL